MHRTAHASRSAIRASAGLVAVVATITVLAISGAHEGQAAMSHRDDPTGATATLTDRQLAFHDAMRTLWEQHVAWTRLAIVGFAAGSPDLAATEARLLRNQADIGNAVKPFYGRRAGNALTRLLEDHIKGAVALLEAAKAADSARLATARTAWYANGRQIADFLHAANRHNWPRRALRAMMRTHLDQTLREAVDQLTGRYATGIRQYDAIERHILVMADTLSMGIIRQFPARFR
jgi:hypothetical protein